MNTAFEAWFQAEMRAERLYWADYEGCRSAWEACEKQAAERMAQIARTALGVAA